MKKILSALIVLTFILSPITPIGSVFVQDHVHKVEARGYKSVRRGFTPTPKRNNQQPKRDNNQNNYNKSTNKSTNANTKKRGFFSGGLARGLMIGGLAGLLFGGFLGNMGAFGSFLGLLINIIAIMFIINIGISIFKSMRANRHRTREDANHWRN